MTRVWILLSVNQFIPCQFDRIDIAIKSNEVCVFNMGVSSNFNGVVNEIASQAPQGQIQLNTTNRIRWNMLLFLINKRQVYNLHLV